MHYVVKHYGDGMAPLHSRAFYSYEEAQKHFREFPSVMGEKSRTMQGIQNAKDVTLRVPLRVKEVEALIAVLDGETGNLPDLLAAERTLKASVNG